MTSPEELTCWSMIRDAAGGDPAARERFARVYLPVVTAYLAARWRTGRHSAEDAAHDVFVECFRAGGLLDEAARAQEEAARQAGPAAVRRVQLLRARFHDGLTIRDIAARWNVDPARLHHEYATAREEFRSALREVVAFHQPGASPGEIDRACGELLGLIA